MMMAPGAAAVFKRPPGSRIRKPSTLVSPSSAAANVPVKAVSLGRDECRTQSYSESSADTGFSSGRAPAAQGARLLLANDSAGRLRPTPGKCAATSSYNYTRVVLLAAAWYFCSVCADNYRREFLLAFRLPNFLVHVQFVTASLACQIIMHMPAVRAVIFPRRSEPTVPDVVSDKEAEAKADRCHRDEDLEQTLTEAHGAPVHTNARHRRFSQARKRALILCIAGLSLTSQLTGIQALTRIHVSNVQTLKALGPVFSLLFVFLMQILIRDNRENGASTADVKAGDSKPVLRARPLSLSSSESWLTLLPVAVGSILSCFLADSSGQRPDSFGCLLAIISCFFDTAHNVLVKKILESKFSALSLSTVMLISSVTAALLSLPACLGELQLASQIARSSLGFIVALPALCFVCFFNNALAYTMMAQLSVVSFSMANQWRRLCVILSSIIWFGSPISHAQAAITILTFAGLWAHQRVIFSRI